VLLSKIKKIPKNTNGRLAIPALAGLLVVKGAEAVVIRELLIERSAGKVRRSETDVLPLRHATNRRM